MSFLLDTNAVSEALKPRPDDGFKAWVGAQDAFELNISVLTFGEIRRGARLLPQGGRRAQIESWLAEAPNLFHDRILDVDLEVAGVWADIAARHRSLGKVVGAIDELIAATALVHDLAVVTRNGRHFDESGCKHLSPWAA